MNKERLSTIKNIKADLREATQTLLQCKKAAKELGISNRDNWMQFQACVEELKDELYDIYHSASREIDNIEDEMMG